MSFSIRAERANRMSCSSRWRRTVIPATVVVLLLSGSVSLKAFAQQLNRDRKLVLQVIDRRFTFGRVSRFVYLRVYSDGFVECHRMEYWDKREKAKKKEMLSPTELQSLQAVLDNPELLGVERVHVFVPRIFDFSNEWDIRVSRDRRVEKIKVFNFSPESARKHNWPYPPALVKLGCSIWKLRHDVYGDESNAGQPFYQIDDCKKALEIQ